MRTYKIYRKDAEVVAVKDGFSYPGFFFTWIWALVKRLWTVGLFFFLLNAFAFSIFEWKSHNFRRLAAWFISTAWGQPAPRSGCTMRGPYCWMRLTQNADKMARTKRVTMLL